MQDFEASDGVVTTNNTTITATRMGSLRLRSVQTLLQPKSQGQRALT
jgi:hypothetical protein